MAKNVNNGDQNNEPLSAQELKRLLELVKTVRYGSVTLIIQDGRAIQIDKNEKMRIV